MESLLTSSHECTDDLTDGSSLIYTSVSAPNSLPTLIHSSLGIQSLLKKQNLKHNVIDRNKILVPPNWDSWGKIRVLREGFDVEGVSSGWGRDIQPSLAPDPTMETEAASISNDPSQTHSAAPESHTIKGTVLPLYEETISDPHDDRTGKSKRSKASIEVQAPHMQTFLSTQLEVMERLKKEEEEAVAAAKEKEKANNPSEDASTRYHDSGAISDQIGPVQFNVGGIQVDAEDMVSRLKDKSGQTGKYKLASTTPDTPRKAGEEKAQNEQLASFFAGLMKNSSRTGSPSSRGERTS